MFERLDSWAAELRLGPSMFAGAISGGLVAMALVVLRALIGDGCESSLCEVVRTMPGQGIFLSGVIAGVVLSSALGASISFLRSRTVVFGFLGMAAAGPLPALWLEPIKQDGGVLAFVSGALVFCVWVLVPLMDWRIVSKLVPNGARGSVLALMFSALAALLLIVDPVRAGAVFFVALAAVSAVGLIAVGASKSVVGGQRAFRTAVGLSALIGVTGWWILVT